MRTILKVRRIPILVTAVATALVGLSGSATAFASSQAPSSYASTLQQAINEQLQDYPGGTQVSPNEVSYDNGHVRVVLPDASGKVPTDPAARPEIAQSNTVVQPDADYTWHGCPYGNIAAWYCFYQDQDFGGRMLQFKDCSGDGVDQSFATWGFSDETSSWVNTSGIEPLSTPVYVGVWHGGTYLWTEEPDSDSSYVGAANNDQAEWFDAVC